MKKILIFTTELLLVASIFISCKKMIEVESPKTSVSSKNVFNNDATAIGAITSLYVDLSSSSIINPVELSSLSCIAGLSSDELTYYNGAGNSTLAAYYQNNLTNSNSGGLRDYWNIAYQRIYQVNAAVEGLTLSNNLTPAVKKQLLGEAKFMRAFYYFYMVNLYGEIPLVLTTDYTVNALIGKSSISIVYQQIVLDLIEAKDLLNDKYLKSDGITPYPSGAEERVRPTKWVATALLARVYLYLNEWSNAEVESSQILENTTQYKLLSSQEIDQVFLKNNKEAIWQLQPVSFSSNTEDANTFVLPISGPSYFNPVYLNHDLVDSFGPDDKRKTRWIGSITANGIKYFFPYKYRVVNSSDPNVTLTEYNIVFRLAEQYLIRAEARAELGNISLAIEDLNEIKSRAGIPLIQPIPNLNKEVVVNAILNERRLELFSEWGNRWFDLKRTSKINPVMSIATPKKGNGLIWNSFKQYYPISINELQANPNLKQVQGY